MSAALSRNKRLEFDKESLIADLNKMGVKKGSHVAVALSFKSIGLVQGGPKTFINALLEAVGPEGTIMMNTFSKTYPITKIPSDHIFNRFTTPNTGAVPLEFLKFKQSIRSQHPAVSVAAAGKYANYLTQGHNANAESFLPYQKLSKIGGLYLAIGLNNKLAGIRHEAQRKAGLWLVPKFTGIHYLDDAGERQLLIWKNPPCPQNLTCLVPPMEKMGIIKRGRVGEAPALIGSAKEIIDNMTNQLKSNPSLGLCNNFFCYECQEIEKRIGLKNRTDKIALFRRNRLLKNMLALRKNLLLRSYGTITRSHNILGQQRLVDMNLILEYYPQEIIPKPLIKFLEK